MDTRRPNGRERDRVEPELGTDTVPVELIELHDVGKEGGAPRSKVVIAVALVALATFGAVIASAQRATPAPTQAPVALASDRATPASTPTAAAVHTLPPIPTTPPVIATPQPTLPPWWWVRTDFDGRTEIGDDGAWGVDDHVLTLVSSHVRSTTWLRAMARIDDTGAVSVFRTPAGLDDLRGGSVIGQRLWFLAGPQKDNDAGPWQLMGTSNGESWRSFGATTGLDNVAAASFIRRLGSTWVIGTYRKGYSGAGRLYPEDLLWSADGKNWQPSAIPELAGVLQVDGVAMLGDTLVAIVAQYPEDAEGPPYQAAYSAISTVDGRTWQVAPVQLYDGRPGGLQCGHGRCILMVLPQDEEQASPTRLWLESTNGRDWIETTIALPYEGSNSQFTDLAVTPTGFIATTGLSSPVLLSDDGISWRSVEVWSPGLPDDLNAFAVAGDLVVALSDGGSSDVPDRYYIGSAYAMAAAP